MFPVFKRLIASALLLLLIGCAGVTPVPTPAPVPESPATEETLPPTAETVPPEMPPEESGPLPTEPEETPREPLSPRALASLELSRQAENLIGEGQLDEAIRTLEQAINLHPGSGESYYYLAEAWRLKGNARQATEYNTLAAIRFKDDNAWMRRIDVQKEKIERIR